MGRDLPGLRRPRYDLPTGLGTQGAVSWLTGIALGVFIGGLTLEAGALALLVLIPGLVWAAHERSRPLGLGGLLLALA